MEINTGPIVGDDAKNTDVQADVMVMVYFNPL